MFFSLFFVVSFFETTEDMEEESNQKIAISIFLFVLCGWFFENTEDGGGVASNKIDEHFYMCS